MPADPVQADALVEVIQADIDAAVQLLSVSWEGDPTTVFIRHFARHRLASQPSTEPVVVIGPQFSLLWASGDTLTDIANRTGIKVGSNLYARPPADKARIEALEAALKPFADVADYFDAETEGFCPEDHLDIAYDGDAGLNSIYDRLTLRSFQAARAALKYTPHGQ